MSEFGRRLIAGPDTVSLRFERTYTVPAAELWEAITSPDRLRTWLAEVHAEWRLGGAVSLVFGPGERAEGNVTEFDPPRVLAYTWRWRNERPSIVRFEIEQQEGQTRLVVMHSQLGRASSTNYGAGWHAHLDALDAMFKNVAFSWSERFDQLRFHYDRDGEIA